jgi:hypothetical protein
MPRGKVPNTDNHWSDAHLRFLSFMARKLIRHVGEVVPVDELVAVGWLKCLRHVQGPNFHGMGGNVYKNMLEYARATESGVGRAARKRGVCVRQFPADIDLDAIDFLTAPHTFNDSAENAGFCAYVLDRLKTKESQLLRAIYIEGQSRAAIARKRGCSRWSITLQDRKALAHARQIVNRSMERQTA